VCGIILLILGIVFATRIPGILKQTPDSYPSRNPALFDQWRKKELGSIYVFLGATWGQMAIFFMIGLMVGVSMANNPEGLNSAVVVLTVVEGCVFLGGLIWAAILGSQASKLKKELMIPGSMPTDGAYPRYGQTVVSMPPAPQTPPQAPQADEAPPEGPKFEA
jgi:hypothetical protein